MSEFFGASVTFEATDSADAARVLDLVLAVLDQGGKFFVCVTGPVKIPDE